MTREKIVELAIAHGANTSFLHFEQLETFYHVVQAEAFEAAASHLNILAMQAKRSMELGTEADDPSTWVTFDEAADAIREMAKDQS